MSNTVTPGNTASGLFTCVTCHVAFKDPDNQRTHFQTEWHAYNLKRKVANMKPVTKAEFESKVEAQQVKDKEEEAKANYFAICHACNKQYSSENAYTNHLQSKKHKENELEFLYSEEKEKKPKKEQTPKDQADPENLTEEEFIERQIATARRFEKEECIFCNHKSKTFDDNVDHMTAAHSFYIPDIEYLVDIEGFMRYLGEKVSVGNICLYCNGKGKGFYTTEAVQKHMLDKGHCKLHYEDESAHEYGDFYDFRPSYPDYKEGQDNDDEDLDEEDELDNAPIISEDGGELVLPNGNKLGHRSLNRYYKQKFKPEDTRTSVAVSRLMGQYKALGWHTTTQPHNVTQIEQLKGRERKQMELGVRANRLQRHFRRQVDF